MNSKAVKEGLQVHVANLNDSPNLVEPTFLANRRMDAVGIVMKSLKNQNHSWWVRHDHGIAAYSCHEIEPTEIQPVDPATWRGGPLSDTESE